MIKADGLAAGKGVVIALDAPSANEAITDMIDRGRFGAAGARVLIEEFLEGWECSLHVLVTGDRYQVLGTACDHKRLLDGNEGPNTGGMGAYSPAAAWDARLEKQFDEKIMQPLLRALARGKDSLFRAPLSRPDDHRQNCSRFGIQLPFWRSRDASHSAAPERRPAATPRSNDRRANRRNENRTRSNARLLRS